MSGRVGYFCVGLVFWVSACADVLQFKDFQAGPGDATVEAAGSSGEPDAGDGRALANGDATAVTRDSGDATAVANDSGDATTVANDSGDADGPITPPPGSVVDASCADACVPGASCDNGSCTCSSEPDLCPTGCFDWTSDPAHCGGCNVVCATGATCANSVCTCPAAQPEACGGACVYTQTDHDNCGGCGTACAATSACHGGVCTACGTFASDKMCGSICVDESSDVGNCGACGHRCPSGATCTMGVCACSTTDPTTCPTTGTDAGACVDTATDNHNCGGCGNVCKLAHATSGCSTTCEIVSCDQGYSDCDKTASNGCEVHTSADPNNCGVCHYVCSLPHATAGCSAGSCDVVACAEGYANCDGISSNGCEVDTEDDPKNCGACSTANASHACPASELCVSSTCTCAAGTHDCSGTCASDTSVTSCGGSCTPCGIPMNGQATCSGTPLACGVSCPNVLFPVLCAATCTNTMTDGNNCGSCGAQCASGDACVDGACAPGPDAGGEAGMEGGALGPDAGEGGVDAADAGEEGDATSEE
jgi:hypothetical protein